jgi:hypothetical protein
VGWEDVATSKQAYLLDTWLNRHWKNLAEFCLAFKLDYHSTRAAFKALGVIQVVRDDKINVSELSSRVAQAFLHFSRQTMDMAGMLQASVMQDVLYDESLKWSEKLEVIERLSDASTSLSRSVDKSLTLVPIEPKTSGTEVVKSGVEQRKLPPEVEVQVHTVISRHANEIVRQRDKNLLEGKTNA